MIFALLLLVLMPLPVILLLTSLSTPLIPIPALSLLLNILTQELIQYNSYRDEKGKIVKRKSIHFMNQKWRRDICLLLVLYVRFVSTVSENIYSITYGLSSLAKYHPYSREQRCAPLGST